MKYPKLTAALDDVLAHLVSEYGEDTVIALVAGAMPKEVEPVEPKKVEIPVTPVVEHGD